MKVYSDSSAQKQSFMKILVIGATSLVGRRIYEFCQLSNHDVSFSFTTRRPKRDGDIFLDLSDVNASRISGFNTCIFSCPIWLITDEVLESLFCWGIKRLVAFSSTSRFSKTDSLEPKERELADKLGQAEERIEAFSNNHEMNFTILRPTLIYDEGRDNNVSQIARFIERYGFFIVCGKAAGLRQPVHARDLALASIAAARSQRAINKSYNLSGGEILTYVDMVRKIFSFLGKPCFIVSVPATVWRIVFASIHLILPGSKLRLNVNMALRMNKDLVFDHSGAASDFGYSPGPFVFQPTALHAR